MILSEKELQTLKDLREQAAKRNCVVSHVGNEFRVCRKVGGNVVFVGKRNTLKDLEKLIKKI